MGAFVRLEVEDGVGTIRIDRPKMNALDVQVQEEIRAAAHEAVDRSDVSAVIVYGGEKVFAAGADVKEMSEMTFGQMSDVIGDLQSDLAAVSEIPKPTVAAIAGYALGGGLEVALSADRRIAGDNAKLGVPEILLGVIPGGGGTQRLARLIGPSKAKDLLFTGRFVDAEEALAIGLVDEVVAPDDVYEAARRWASQFTKGAGRALAAAKAAVDRGLDVDLTTGLAVERQLFTSLFATQDRKIGMESFIENGPGKAQFTGE
jgi:enoyl-CoA hydratase